MKTIRGIITTALVTWATSKSLTVAREGMGFDKPANFASFIELNIIPSKTIVASLDGTRKRYMGDVLINIWIKDGEGTGLAETLAEEIATLFPVFPKNYLPVSVEDNPSIKNSLLDDSGYRITSVCFSYRAEY